MRVNDEIRLPQVRLIDETGKQIGVIGNMEALDMARERGLDLVEIVPSARPPVVKIMDYGKYQYNKKKQERKNRVKSRGSETKGVRIGIKTDTHDLEVKKNRILKFLKKEYKVSVEVTLKGREKMFRDKAREVLMSFIKNLGAPVAFDQEIKSTPNGFQTVIKSGK
ncbi:MAG: translation initiation factor IF-3 [Patescibacteria group bacterium]|nr:translation initiation factor IF-3 [Patescibacteria group bacterium]